MINEREDIGAAFRHRMTTLAPDPWHNPVAATGR
jgi:hypothetical protein